MGMDLYGEKPSNAKGEYFRNNCWWWRPLWNYVCDECSPVLTEQDRTAGQYNDGHVIAAEKAERIAKRLRALCASGQVLDEVERWCPPNLHSCMGGEEKMCGAEVEILPGTSTIGKARCGGRDWKMTAASVAKIRVLLGLPGDGEELWVCEHMLELD